MTSAIESSFLENKCVSLPCSVNKICTQCDQILAFQEKLGDKRLNEMITTDLNKRTTPLATQFLF